MEVVRQEQDYISMMCFCSRSRTSWVGVEVGWPWDNDEEKMLRKFVFWRRHWVLRWLRRVWKKVMWDAWEDEIDKWFKRAWRGSDPHAEMD